ncbi:MAG: hypothetical protein IKS41_07245 [Alphaproteobacteria bacterium]|nr:hypothetical protein [Alphaproteobacteria bacterium]
MVLEQSKQDIYNKLHSELKETTDFSSFLSQKVTFDGRDWTAGQFLYKYCFDEWQPFAYYARDHFEALTGTEKKLAEKIYAVIDKGLTLPKNAYQFIENGETLDVFNGNTQKETFYQNLFTGPKRSLKNNPCYWHPVSRLQTAFVEYKLAQMGMSEEQILSLMKHCEAEREKAEKKAIQNMPHEFVHNAVLPPDEMTGGKIEIFARSDDNFLNLQKYTFMGPPDTFHAGLPIHSVTDFAEWPRFKADTFVFQISVEDAKKKIVNSYNYYVDMQDKDAFRPCIPLWGGEPLEWVSVKPLKFTDVQKETLRDLIERNKTIYIVPSTDDWKKYMERTCGMSPQEAKEYLASLSKQYPDKVIKLDEKFLSEYEKEYSEHEAERKHKRQERIEQISLKPSKKKENNMKEQLGEASKSVTYYYILPDGKKTLPISGTVGFIREMCEMLDLMTHSPTALKILYHNANLKKPLVIEEFKDALDSGRNTGKSIQIAYGREKDGTEVSKYGWLTLVPHEFRHSYNMPKSKSQILHGIAYSIANEPDAHAMGGLIAMELCDYLERSGNPEAAKIQKHLSDYPEHKVFRKLYEETKGEETERKAETVLRFTQWWAQYYVPKFGKTFAEQAYQVAIERDTTQDGGWQTCTEEEFKKIEEVLLGKRKYEEIANEPFMKGRIPISDERALIQREWPTFCKRLMDGTYNTDVLPYGQDIKPADLIQIVSPKLAAHLKKIGIIPRPSKNPVPTPTPDR